MAIPQPITSSIIDQLSLFKRRDRSNVFPLQRLRREAEKLKDVSLAEYYTVQGAIACIEFDTDNMHSYHKKAISLGSNLEVYNYIASLEIACLWDEAFAVAINAFNHATDDFGALNKSLDKAAKTLRFRELRHLLLAWRKFCPGEEHQETKNIETKISYMDAHGLSDEDTSTFSRLITDVLHTNGVIISHLKYRICDNVLEVDYLFADEHLNLRKIFAEVEASVSGHSVASLARISFNGKKSRALTTRDEVAERIFSDWNDTPQAHISLKLLDFILENDSAAICHLTYGSIRKVIGKAFEDAQVFEALQYLTGDRVPLLRMAYEFIDLEDVTYQVSPSELSEAETTGQFVHPRTGELVDDFETNILFYFQPGPLVQQLVL